jgi:predicted transcriptional regulator
MRDRSITGRTQVKRPKTNRPTDGELEILQVLWIRGHSTVRDVYQAINEIRPIGYTTVLKLMQIMTEKGILRADKGVRPQVFEPAKPRRETQGLLVRDLLDRAFNGSPGRLVLQALSAEKATAEERKKIREILDRMEDESQ